MLVVDDEPYVRRRIRSFRLEEKGFTVVGEADNGVQALELARRLRPHIVLADIGMPVMDGLELLRALKEERHSPEVVMLTCYEDFEKVQLALRYGATDYLTKLLFKESELLAALGRAAEKALLLEERRREASRDWLMAAASDAEEESRPVGRGDIREALAYIHANYRQPLSLSAVAQQVNLSASWFAALFRQETGRPFTEYVQELRLRQAKQLLRETDKKVYEVACDVGIPNAKYFSRLFCEAFGMSPAEYKRRLTGPEECG